MTFWLLPQHGGGHLKNDFLNEILHLKHIMGQRPIILLASPKTLSLNTVELYNRNLYLRNESTAFLKESVNNKHVEMSIANGLLKKLADAEDGIYFISRDSLFSYPDNNSLEWMPDGLPYHIDYRHLSIYGSKATYHNFKLSPQFESIKKVLIHSD